MPNYEETALTIIKDAIKSAIFIDENAREPFMAEEPGEAMRSEELYKDFRAKGISLSIYKYDDATYDAHKEYLFNNRDLVLLDWKLDDNDGEDKSLDILANIVNMQPHIHFCVIYTSENQEVVLNNILSYFSCLTYEEYEEIREDFEAEKEKIDKLLPDLILLSQNRFNRSKRGEVFKELIRDRELKAKVESHKILNKDKSLGLLCAYIRLGIAFSKHLKSNDMQPCPSDIDTEHYTVCINNTLISVLNKRDVSASRIFERFSQQIAQYEKGVMHLVGLEMRNIQRKGGTFIDSNVLAVTKETLGYHKMQSDKNFTSFIKDVMVEQLKTNISEDDLSIISAITPCGYQDKPECIAEYAAMNVFYNSQRRNEINKRLTFGDVFKCEDKFYICITALCDCAHPDKRNHCFYFAEGRKITLDKALDKGDSGYISYISRDCCVQWDNPPIKGEYSYIVPINYMVPDNCIVNDKLNVYRFKDKKVEDKEFEYLTTIRQNYAQRIANYAFAHPLRVGIDFVKK